MPQMKTYGFDNSRDFRALESTIERHRGHLKVRGGEECMKKEIAVNGMTKSYVVNYGKKRGTENREERID